MFSRDDLTRLTLRQIFELYAEVLEELKRRGVTRSQNNPVGDYAEDLVCRALRLDRASKSNRGFDAIHKTSGKKYEIKARRLTSGNTSRQLGVIRNLERKQFDYLVGVLFNQDFTVRAACLIPHALVGRFARLSTHQNGHVLHLRDEILCAEDVRRIDELLKKEERAGASPAPTRRKKDLSEVRPRPRTGIGAAIVAIICRGGTYEEALATARRIKPDSAFDRSHWGWYRNMAKKHRWCGDTGAGARPAPTRTENG